MAAKIAYSIRNLGDCADLQSGGTPFKGKPSYWGGNIPWVSAKDMKLPVLDDTEDHVTDEGAQNGTRVAGTESVLLLVRGMTLHNDVPLCRLKRPMAFNQDIKALKPKDGVATEFLYYWLLAMKPILLGMVDAAGHGTGRLITDQLKEMELQLPPISEQRKVAGILQALDDRIEVNRRMCRTLEGMAAAVFKAWFVDFEPVRAKAEGRWRRGQSLPGLPAHLFDLFPCQFQDSPLGPIPKGWEAGTLADFASLNPESWSKSTRPNEIEYVDLANTKWGRIESTVRYSGKDAPSRAQRVLRPGDTIVGTVRPGNGSYSYVLQDGLTGSTGFAVLRPHSDETREIVYLIATRKENIERLAHLADGGAYPAVRPEIVLATETVKPDNEVVAHFSRIAMPLLVQVAQMERASKFLAVIRDALLPRLLSGDLQLSDVEDSIQSAHL